jgi:hypothetical protein
MPVLQELIHVEFELVADIVLREICVLICQQRATLAHDHISIL